MSAGGLVPGLNNVHLHLSGPVLAGIYSGHIMYWDDAKIKDINREYASKLPHKAIVPIHRADGSGDTFLFTQYFSKSTPSWASGPGYGTTISWPSVASAVGATGNPGIVQTCQNTPYSVAPGNADAGLTFTGCSHGLPTRALAWRRRTDRCNIHGTHN